MNAKETKMLSIIDKQIAELQKMKEQLLATKPLSDIVKDKPWLWVIEKETNTYYQFVGFAWGDDIDIHISRHGVSCGLTSSSFNSGFRIATSVEYKQHIEHLERTGKSYIKQDFTQRVEQREASERKVVNLDFASLYQNEVLGIDVQEEITKWLKSMSKPFCLDVKHTGGLNQLKQCKLEPRKIDPKKCDFYMVTVTGEFGAKVRHDNYDNAIKEATRLAKKQNHKAWVTGVVAVIEPIQQEVQVKVIEK